MSVVLDGSVGVLRALQTLPAGERQVLVLHHLQDMTVPQIAAHSARPVAAVQTDLDRARARLARCLREGALVALRSG